jgi:hypothetical protein
MAGSHMLVESMRMIFTILANHHELGASSHVSESAISLRTVRQDQ